VTRNVPDVLKLFHSHSGMDNPDVLKLFHRHSVWMIRISVLVVYERYRRANTGISLLPILFACEINIKFNSTFFFFDENIQIICLK
jgi:hypothetical protein